MKFASRPLSLTLVDIFGSILPGLVWFLVIFASIVQVSQKNADASPVAIVKALCDGTFAKVPAATLATVVFLASLLIGYSIKPIAMRIAESLTFPAEWIVRYVGWMLTRARGLKSPQTFRTTATLKDVAPRTPTPPILRSYRSPFAALYADDLKKTIRQKISSIVGCQVESLPLNEFSISKRIVRVISPPLWEEAEHREAEARMVGSLTLAATYSFLCAAISYGRLPTTNCALWVIGSITSVFVLGAGFRYLRKREVDFSYLNLLISLAVSEGRLRPVPGVDCVKVPIDDDGELGADDKQPE